MEVFDLTSNPSFWEKPKVFKQLENLLVHGKSLGTSHMAVAQSLISEFSLDPTIVVPEKITSQIHNLLQKAVGTIKNYFELSETTVFICGINDSEKFANRYLGGVSGYAWPNSILLFYNPNHQWQDSFYNTALHEFNHCHRYKHHDPYSSFLAWLVFEGLAEEFVAEVIGNKHKSYMIDETTLKFLPTLKSFWHGYPQNPNAWFFGDSTHNIPFGLGYKIGHHLVQNFRKNNSTLSWADLMKLPAADFIKSN